MIRLLVLTALVATSAYAQDEPTAVSPVTVMPRTDPPKVASSYPAEGQDIAPGVLVLKLAFDQRMDPRGWSYTTAPDGAAKPECVATPRLLKDEKTFVLLCRVTSGKTYKVALNPVGAPPTLQGPPRLQGGGEGRFANVANNPAAPHVLSFQVVKGEPVTTIPRAMSAAGLKIDETPIEDDPARASTNIVTR